MTALSVIVPLFPLIKNKKLDSCRDYDEYEERQLSDVWNMTVTYYKCYLSFFPLERLSWATSSKHHIKKVLFFHEQTCHLRKFSILEIRRFFLFF